MKIRNIVIYLLALSIGFVSTFVFLSVKHKNQYPVVVKQNIQLSDEYIEFAKLVENASQSRYEYPWRGGVLYEKE